MKVELQLVEIRRVLFNYSLLCLIFITAIGELVAQDFSVMTYNIRYDNQWDTINSWEKRKESVIKIIEESGVDIFGIQEALHNQIEDLQEAFSGFEYVGVGREDGKTKGEYAAIFYVKDKFELIDEGTFWLSESPGKPSVGWDASMERICTYAHLKHLKTSKSFWIFNAHYDHIGVQSRVNSTTLILEKMNQFSGSTDPIIIMGDFNVEQSEEPIVLFKKEKFHDISFTSSDIRVYRLGTFNGFQKEFKAKKIDYIFARNVFGKDYRHIFDTMPNGNYPSDHFPIVLGIEFK